METVAAAKPRDTYRDYENPGRDTVREFYRLNHTHQTHDFVLAKKAEYLRFDRKAMTPWDALDYLNTLVDDSDPDIALPQIDHLLQTSEAIRADGHPEWMVLTGFIHDLGKVLCLFGEPQWAVVGDTNPVGCRFSSIANEMSAPGNAMPAPEAAFVDALKKAAPALLRERRSHAGRVFVAALEGALTYEALVDMQPSVELEAVLRSLPLAPPPSGYASQRLFFLALPRQGRSAHVRTGRCTPATGADAAPSPGRSRVWIGLTLALAVLATVYFVLR